MYYRLAIVWVFLVVWPGLTVWAQGPLIYYSLDSADTVGSSVLDRSGHGHDGTLYGHVVTGVPGVVAEAMQFPGDFSRARVEVAPGIVPLGAAARAFVLWFKQLGVQGNNQNKLLGYGDRSAGRAIDVSLEGGGIRLRHWGGNITYGSGFDFLGQDSGFHHLVVQVRAQTGTFADVEVYLDGQRLAVTDTGGGGTSQVLDTADSAFALGSGENDFDFQGILDEVQIYDRALSEEEIGQWIVLPMARDPQPAHQALLLDTSVTLTWTPGDLAVSHTVYVGTSRAAVLERQAEARVVDSLLDTSWSVELSPAETYYWCVDTFNPEHPDSPWLGPVWEFRVAPEVTADSNAPNIVFFLVDDLGWTDLGCYGSTFYETPNVDRLCASGMKFTNAHAACPVCSPTRASIMAGKYPARMNTTDWFGAVQPQAAANKDDGRILIPAPYVDHLPLEEVTLAEALHEHGYATFFAGKWHLGSSAYYPEKQGFDINKGGCHLGNPGGGGYFSPYKAALNLAPGPPGEHLPDRLAKETVQFIEAYCDRPFLAYLSFYEVHTPLQGRDDLTAKYQQKKQDLGLKAEWGKDWATPGNVRSVRLVQEHAVYAGMVEAMDLAVGKVLDTLDRLGLRDNTIVVFMSDNGGLSTSEGSPTSNVPLRAGKGWMYEGGIREAMIIRAPGVTIPGSVATTPVISTDFYPTLLDLADLPLRPDQHVDGISLLPLLQGKTLDRGPLFWHYPHYGNQGGAPSGAVRDGDWKLVEWYEDGRLELFNLAEDIGERNNLFTSHSDLGLQLRDRLHAWRDEVEARMPTHRSSSSGSR